MCRAHPTWQAATADSRTRETTSCRFTPSTGNHGVRGFLAAGKIRNVNIVYIADEAEPHRESDPPNIIVTDFLKQGSQLLEMLLLSRACSIRHAWGFATDLLQVLFRDAYRLHDDSSPEIKDLPQQPH